LEVKAEVVEEEGKTVVYLPVCRRVAGEIVCVEKGIRVVYGSSGGKPVLEEISTEYPKGGEGERVEVTSYYQKGVIGPVKVVIKREGSAET